MFLGSRTNTSKIGRQLFQVVSCGNTLNLNNRHLLHTQTRIDDEIYRETHCTGSHYSEKAKFDNKVTSVDAIEPGDGDSGGE